MPAGHVAKEQSQLLAPAALKVLEGQGEQGGKPPTPNVPLRHGRVSVNVVGVLHPQAQLPVLSYVAKVRAPPAVKGEGATLPLGALKTGVGVEDAFGPSKMEKGPSQ